MDAVALSNEEQAYFETGGEAVPSSVSDIPQTPSEPINEPAPELDTNDNAAPENVRDEKGRFVPHQALHAEREERKKAQAELQTLRERQAILEDRWNTILKVQEPPAEEAKGPPNPDEDIFGYMKWQGEQLSKLQQERENEVKQRQEYEQQTQAEREVTTYWQSSVQEYAAREPDFQPAAQWLSDYRHKQLEALAPIDPNMANPAVRNQQIDAELKQIISVAKQKGQNPAELVHQLAKGWGYNGQSASSPKVNDTLASLEAAQKASRTLAASGGRSSSDPLTPEAIASMSNEEFAQWSADPANQKRFERMLKGGA
jgi:hypothetical protein